MNDGECLPRICNSKFCFEIVCMCQSFYELILARFQFDKAIS